MKTNFQGSEIKNTPSAYGDSYRFIILYLSYMFDVIGVKVSVALCTCLWIQQQAK